MPEDSLKYMLPTWKRQRYHLNMKFPLVEEFCTRIHDISTQYPYLKAVMDGKIVGYVYANTFKERKSYDWSVETTVYVDEQYKKMGIGKALYQELEKELKKMGILNMNACIASPAHPSMYLTDDSIRFHHALGFMDVGIFHDSGYKFDEWFDMIWMEKMIGEHKNGAEPVKFGI